MKFGTIRGLVSNQKKDKQMIGFKAAAESMQIKSKAKGLTGKDAAIELAEYRKACKKNK